MTCANDGTGNAGQKDRGDKSADQIEQEAAVWIVRLDLNAALEDTREAHAAWLNDHPRHRAAYLRLSLAWKRTDVLRRLAPLGEEPDPDMLAP